MKANRLLVSFAVSAALFSTTAMAVDGRIQFQGDIVDTPCVVAQNSQYQTINLGQVKVGTFTGANVKAPPTPFQIELKDCKLDPTTPEKAYITFTGSSVQGQSDVLVAGSPQGGATGVGIQIVDNVRNVIPINTQHNVGMFLANGTNKLNFEAAYISTQATVTPGQADGFADFEFEYK